MQNTNIHEIRAAAKQKFEAADQAFDKNPCQKTAIQLAAARQELTIAMQQTRDEKIASANRLFNRITSLYLDAR